MGLFDRIMGNNQPTHTPIVHNGTGNQPTVVSPPPNPQDGNKAQNNTGGDPKNLPPNGASAATKDDSAISSLEPFKELWKTTTSDGKAPTDPLAQPLLQNDPAKFAEAAKKLNFAQNIPPELVTKALGGDAQAFTDIINNVAQASFMASTQLSNQVVETAARTNNDRFSSVLDKKFKEFMVRETRTDNPVLQHPSAAPMLDLAKRQLLAQHPDKSPAEIHQMAEGFLVSFGEELMGNKSKAQSGSSGPDPYDFSAWDK